MEKKLQKLQIGSVKFKGLLKGVTVDIKQVYLTKDILSLPQNDSVKLEEGWRDIGEKECPPADVNGYYMKVGGNCVYFPY